MKREVGGRRGRTKGQVMEMGGKGQRRKKEREINRDCITGKRIS